MERDPAFEEAYFMARWCAPELAKPGNPAGHTYEPLHAELAWQGWQWAMARAKRLEAARQLTEAGQKEGGY